MLRHREHPVASRNRTNDLLGSERSFGVRVFRHARPTGPELEPAPGRRPPYSALLSADCVFFVRRAPDDLAGDSISGALMGSEQTCFEELSQRVLADQPSLASNRSTSAASCVRPVARLFLMRCSLDKTAAG
jgi:hypothetical protein